MMAGDQHSTGYPSSSQVVRARTRVQMRVDRARVSYRVWVRVRIEGQDRPAVVIVKA